ncbi:MAG: T9SS type A sorting domain-containing protein [Bacteroidales bacterium]|jgi:hypothetical protein|nr:T9SS type A sorting domain-containing protein [Bacteroidales bacterium]
MKKFSIMCCMWMLFATSTYAQSCIEQLPYTPVFGTGTNPSGEQDLWFVDRMSGGRSKWTFNVQVNEGGEIAPTYANTQSGGSAQYSTVFTRCLALDNTAVHQLTVTCVATSPGATRMQIFLVEVDSELEAETDILYAYDYDIDDAVCFIDTIEGVVNGENECSVIINEFTAAPSAKYRIGIRVENTPSGSSLYLKDIELSEMQTYDLKMVGLNSPLSNCNLPNQTVSFKIRNDGYHCPPSYNVCYQRNTGEGTPYSAPVCKSFSDAIPANDVLVVRLDNTETFGDQTLFKAWVSYDGLTSDTIRPFIEKTNSHTVPYVCSFENYTASEDWIVIPKTTQSNVTWTTDGGKASIKTSGAASDDRLVSGCIDLVKDVLYQISFTYNAQSASFAERMLCYVGTGNVAAPSDTLMDIRDFTNTDQRTITTYFKPSVSGAHYIGFLAYSNASSSGIDLSNLTVEAVQPMSVPTYMGFESYETLTDWQTVNYRTAANGWLQTHTNADVLNYSEQNLSTSALKTVFVAGNNNWVISKPLWMDASKTYTVEYFRKGMSSMELMSVRIGNNPNLQAMTEMTPSFKDTIRETSYSSRTVDFKPSQTGIYYVSFQYHTEGTSGGGLCLDDIMIRDKVAANDTNLSVVRLNYANNSPCELSADERVQMVIKNRGNHNIVAAHGIYPSFRFDGKTVTASQPIAIEPYRTLVINSGSLDMTRTGVFEIQGWISGSADKGKTDDTSAVLKVEKIEPLTNNIHMGFESGDNTNVWTKNEGWAFTRNESLAHSGTSLAYLAPASRVTGDSVRQAIGTPCIALGPDTTYLISFFYRAATEVDPTNTQYEQPPVTLNVYVGTNNSTSNQRLSSMQADATGYNQYIGYYRSTGTGPYYTFIEGVSRSWARGLCVDDFVIIDSATAQKRNLSITSFNLASSNKCDLSPDTLFVEIANNGFFPYENPTIKIQIGSNILSDRVTGIINPRESEKFRLTQMLTHTAYGDQSVRVWIEEPNNHPEANDTAATLVSTKQAPITEFPYVATFPDGWNNLEEYQNPDGSAFEYWQTGSGSNEMHFANGPSKNKPGFLASGCFTLKPDEPYIITYRYKAAASTSTENLRLMKYNADETTETLFTQPSSSFSTAYQTKVVSYTTTGANERFVFASNSNNQAQGVYIDYFSIVEDTAGWPADVRMLAISSPKSDTALSATERVTVRVTNNALRPLKNVPIYYQLNGVLVEETIPSLTPGQVLNFTFAQTADLSSYQSYELVIFSGLSDDLDRTNDTLRATVTCYPPAESSVENLVSDVQFAVYPNPATTHVVIRSDKTISKLLIHTITGKFVTEIALNSTEYQLNTSDFPTGVYLFSCQIGQAWVQQKVIIETNRL